MFNRWIEDDLLDVLDAEQIGCTCFSVAGDGVVDGQVPRRRSRRFTRRPPRRFLEGAPDRETLAKIRTLNDIAPRRGQSLAPDGTDVDSA